MVECHQRGLQPRGKRHRGADSSGGVCQGRARRRVPVRQRGSNPRRTRFIRCQLNPESLAGDMHLNADCRTGISGGDTDMSTLLRFPHEAGTTPIGMGHSDLPGDVMYPYYKRGMQLSANDIGAAQALYGAATTAPQPITKGPAPLSLTLNPIAPPGQAAVVSISGGVSGGTPPLTVGWQTDHGYSGKAVAGSGGTWSAGGISLVTGANTLTVTAFDSTQQTASESAVADRLQAAPSGPAAPIAIHITSPSAAVVTASSPAISLSGTASGVCGITQSRGKLPRRSYGNCHRVGP